MKFKSWWHHLNDAFWTQKSNWQFGNIKTSHVRTMICVRISWFRLWPTRTTWICADFLRCDLIVHKNSCFVSEKNRTTTMEWNTTTYDDPQTDISTHVRSMPGELLLCLQREVLPSDFRYANGQRSISDCRWIGYGFCANGSKVTNQDYIRYRYIDIEEICRRFVLHNPWWNATCCPRDIQRS